MEIKCKQCEKKFKATTGEIKNGKKYCSRNCQYESYRKLKSERIERTCLNCGDIFLKTEYRIKIDGGKYCSRKCKDAHQESIYKKDGNPVYGTELSEERKRQLSENTKKMWTSKEHRRKFSKKVLEFYNKNGYYPGTDELSKEKKRKTNLERYGTTCFLDNKELKKKWESEYFLKNGMSTIQNASKSLFKKRSTKIEEKIKTILEKNSIEFKKNFFIRCGSGKNEFRIYDFYLKKYNLLIEADGDYWHANPKFYKNRKLNETQNKNIKNDIFKNELAIKKSFNIIRFWENEINDINFENFIIEKIKEYGKKNTNL